MTKRRGGRRPSSPPGSQRRFVAAAAAFALSSQSPTAHAFRGGGPPIAGHRHRVPPPAFLSSASSSSNEVIVRGTRRRILPSPLSSPSPPLQHLLRMSSVGGGNEYRPPPGGGGGGNGPDDGDGTGGLSDFLGRDGEGDDLRAARAEISEGRLPASYGSSPTTAGGAETEETDEDDDDDTAKELADAAAGGELSSSSKYATAESSSFTDPGQALADNPYLRVVSSIGPSELIGRFTATAHPRVQDAVRSTILGLIGNLPKMAFETTTVTTGAKLASLMFQLQMTGYMFKNAEYRLSLSQSLGMSMEDTPVGGAGGAGLARPGFLLEGNIDAEQKSEGGRKAEVRPGAGEVHGKIRVRYGGAASSKTEESSSSSTESDGDDADEDGAERPADASTSAAPAGGMEVEVDASAFTSELRSEVRRLREELDLAKQTRNEEVRKDLLRYIRTLPAEQMQELTSTVSPDVLAAMKGLVNAVLAGIAGEAEGGEGGAGDDGDTWASHGKIGPNTVTEQSGEAMAQLCMWQLVVGYNLRELEVREEMRVALLGGSGSSGGGSIRQGDDNGDGGVGTDGGAFE